MIAETRNDYLDSLLHGRELGTGGRAGLVEGAARPGGGACQ